MSDISSSSASSRGGIGFLGLLIIVLVILKATGFLAISWFLCFLPIIIGISIGLIVFGGHHCVSDTKIVFPKDPNCGIIYLKQLGFSYV